MKSFSRLDRLNKEVQRLIGTYCEREYEYEEYGMITITEVHLSTDLRHAKVLVSVFIPSTSTQTREDIVALLNAEEYKIKAEIANGIRMKYVPKLHFHIDDSQDKVDEVANILRKITHD